MDRTIRVLIVDDHLVVREGLRMIFETVAGLSVVGEASDGATAVRLVGEIQPDVVLMDLRLPGMDGLEAMEYIRKQWPQVAVVILTTYNEDALMIRGFEIGAHAYLLKDTNRETLINTIYAAARGETLIQPEIMARIIAYKSSQGPQIQARPSRISELTEREHEVLAAVAMGERSKEIAMRLRITERTIKAHLSSIYNKLGVDSRAAAVAVIAQHGEMSGLIGRVYKPQFVED